MNNSWKLLTVLAVGSLAGCGSRPQAVVEQPAVKITEKETVRIKAMPEEGDRAEVIIKPLPDAGVRKPEKKTETVKPKATPSALPEPAIQKQGEVPVPESDTPQDAVVLTPKPTDAPAAKPTATPKPAAKPSGNSLVVKAEVVSTSRMPQPQKVTYKDALIFTKYKVLSVENGQYKEKEIVVAEWAMKDKKLVPSAQKRVGQVQTLTLEPLAKRKELESVMRSDDTEAYDLEPYFVK
jgi:hypothetical protein